VKRFVAVLAVLVLPVIGFTPGAGAVGYGACTITGTISFSSGTLSSGTWTIGPAVIDCQGIVAGRRRITGRGPFRGSGSYTSLLPGDGGCLRQSGSGKVEYSIPTTAGEIHVDEAASHTLAIVGTLTTPTLDGPFEVAPPYSGGDCLTKTVGKATFVAEVLLYRYARQLPPQLPYI
jgi:hypothetical protein